MTIRLARIMVFGLVAMAGPPRNYTTVVPLETTAETSANVSMGDLDGDGVVSTFRTGGSIQPGQPPKREPLEVIREVE